MKRTIKLQDSEKQIDFALNFLQIVGSWKERNRKGFPQARSARK